MNDDSLMKPNEVADFFRVATHTIYVWAYDGKIPYSKINGCIRFKRGDITKMIEDGRRYGRNEERTERTKQRADMRGGSRASEREILNARD